MSPSRPSSARPVTIWLTSCLKLVKRRQTSAIGSPMKRAGSSASPFLHETRLVSTSLRSSGNLLHALATLRLQKAVCTHRLTIKARRTSPNAFVSGAVPSLPRIERSRFDHGSPSSKNAISAARASDQVIPLDICSLDGCFTQYHPYLWRSRWFRRRRSHECSSPAGIRSGFVRTANSRT